MVATTGRTMGGGQAGGQAGKQASRQANYVRVTTTARPFVCGRHRTDRHTDRHEQQVEMTVRVSVCVCAAGAGTDAGAGAAAAASASKQAGRQATPTTPEGRARAGLGKQQLAVVRGGSGWAESTTLDEARRKRADAPAEAPAEAQARAQAQATEAQGAPAQMGTTCRRRTWPFTCRKRKPVTCPQPRPTNGTPSRLTPTRPSAPLPMPMPGPPAPARDKHHHHHHLPAASGAPGQPASQSPARLATAAGGDRAGTGVGSGQWAMGQAAGASMGSSDEIIGAACPPGLYLLCLSKYAPHIPPSADMLHTVPSHCRPSCALLQPARHQRPKKGGVWACMALDGPRCDTARRPVTRRRASDLRRSLSRDAMHIATLLLYLHDDDPGCRQHSNCKRTSRAARLVDDDGGDDDDDDDAARFVSLRSRPGSLSAPPSFAAPATHRTHIPAPSQPALWPLPSLPFFVLTYSRALLAGCVYMVQSVIAPRPPSNQPWHLLPFLQTPTVS
ncbi:hypothetical protein J3E71DRAFT_378508 [Bipolaris maydis]|nr:hypothetical protein J3E71DRAFT_378508 [Bipolaris maydis]